MIKYLLSMLIVFSLFVGYPMETFAAKKTTPTKTVVTKKTTPTKTTVAKKTVKKSVKKVVKKKIIKRKERLITAPALFTLETAPSSAKPVAKKKPVTKKKTTVIKKNN